MQRSALITTPKVQNNSLLAKLPFKYARTHQSSPNEMFGKVPEMPQTGNTRFSPGSPNGCGRGLDWENYVKGEEKFFRPAGVGYLIGDSSKTKQVFGGGRGLRSKRLWK